MIDMRYSHIGPRPKRYYRNMNFEIAEKIRTEYFSRTATQQELADKYGIKQNSVSRIISGLVWSR